MSLERPQSTEPFAFTERERLWERISHERFKALLDDERTTIHKADVDTNSYGEFLFVTISRPETGERQVLTLFGLGYHEHRERWYTEEWAWYQTSPFPETLEQRLTRQETEELLQSRQVEIAPYVSKNTQTERGKLFEMLADLTDEDGALAEMEDLDELWDDLADDLT